MERLYAIGDIHGQYDLLYRLIVKIAPAQEDTFVFLGDYIDRGPDSKRVIEFLQHFSSTYGCVFLKGNHEDMMLKALQDNSASAAEMWTSNGGQATIDSYGDLTDIIPAHGEFFEKLQLMYTCESYVFVHAGINVNLPLNQQTDHDLLWVRDQFIYAPVRENKKIIFGHTPFNEPFVQPDKIGIDTGAGYHGSLTALQLPEERFVSVTPIR